VRERDGAGDGTGGFSLNHSMGDREKQGSSKVKKSEICACGKKVAGDEVSQGMRVGGKKKDQGPGHSDRNLQNISSKNTKKKGRAYRTGRG